MKGTVSTIIKPDKSVCEFRRHVQPLPTAVVGALIRRVSFSALDRKPRCVKRMTMTNRFELIGEISGLLQIDGLVAAILVELGAPHFVRALVLGWTEADERPETHVEITDGF